MTSVASANSTSTQSIISSLPMAKNILKPHNLRWRNTPLGRWGKDISNLLFSLWAKKGGKKQKRCLVFFFKPHSDQIIKNMFTPTTDSYGDCILYNIALFGYLLESQALFCIAWCLSEFIHQCVFENQWWYFQRGRHDNERVRREMQPSEVIAHSKQLQTSLR